MAAPRAINARVASLVTFGKFIVVGLANTATTLAIIFVLKRFLAAGDITANAIGYGVGVCLSYALNSRWTFESGGYAWRQLIQYGTVSLIAYLANLATVLLLIHVAQVNSYWAQIGGAPAYTVTAFLLSRYWVFRRNTRPAA